MLAKIGTPVDAQADDFQRNSERMQSVVETLRGTIQRIVRGTDEKSIQRHVSKGKLLVRDRISALLDPG
ncbi:hypothetical protein BV898_19835, partial [Hypsibius exemplaris]